MSQERITNTAFRVRRLPAQAKYVRWAPVTHSGNDQHTDWTGIAVATDCCGIRTALHCYHHGETEILRPPHLERGGASPSHGRASSICGAFRFPKEPVEVGIVRHWSHRARVFEGCAEPIDNILLGTHAFMYDACVYDVSAGVVQCSVA